MELKDNLKKYRLQANLTQAEIAEQLNISVTAYSGYETGRRTPSIETLKKTAVILNVSIDDLLGLTPYPFKKMQFKMNNGEIVEAVDTRESVIAFNQFLRTIGYALSQSDDPSEENQYTKWLILDKHTKKVYLTNSEQLSNIYENVTAYTKFQFYELISKLKQIKVTEDSFTKMAVPNHTTEGDEE